jgi:hypothetical protein
MVVDLALEQILGKNSESLMDEQAGTPLCLYDRLSCCNVNLKQSAANDLTMSCVTLSSGTVTSFPSYGNTLLELVGVSKRESSRERTILND